MEENHTQQLKDELKNLEAEARSLPINLSACVSSGNSSKEIIRLRGRERDLPAEIDAATVMLIHAQIEELESLQTDAYRKWNKAKEDSRDLDNLVSVQLRILDVERAKLNQDVLTGLTLPRLIENEINVRSGEIANLKKRLNDFI